MVGITSIGGYLPRRRLSRQAIFEAHRWFNGSLAPLAKGTKAMANWDEDAVTMGVEAARTCLSQGDTAVVGSVLLASTALPFVDRQNAGLIKEALYLPDEILTLDVTGSQKSATSALISALRQAEQSTGKVLCIASHLSVDRPASESEISNGDGAAALCVGNERPIARFLGAHSVSVDFVDHYRRTGSDHDYRWESRWVREEGCLKIITDVVGETLGRLDIDPEQVRYLLIPSVVPGISPKIAKKLNVQYEDVTAELQHNAGFLGGAHPLAMFVHCLEQAVPGETIVLVGFGQGCDVLVFETTQEVEQCGRAFGDAIRAGQLTENYLRYLVFRERLDIERGMRAELDQKTALSAHYRDRKAILGLVGGRCRESGIVQFPPNRMSIDVDKPRLDTQEEYRLADIPARVVTCTADHLAYTPDPPYYYGMIEFDGGGRMATEFTDVAEGEIDVGAAVKMMFRIKAVDDRRDFVRYFWKAVSTATN